MDAIKNLRRLLTLYLNGRDDIAYNIFNEAVGEVEREMANRDNEIANLRSQLDRSKLHSDTSNSTLVDNFFDNFKVSIGKFKDSFHDCVARIDDEE